MDGLGRTGAVQGRNWGGGSWQQQHEPDPIPFPNRDLTFLYDSKRAGMGPRRRIDSQETYSQPSGHSTPLQHAEWHCLLWTDTYGIGLLVDLLFERERQWCVSLFNIPM